MKGAIASGDDQSQLKSEGRVLHEDDPDVSQLSVSTKPESSRLSTFDSAEALAALPFPQRSIGSGGHCKLLFVSKLRLRCTMTMMTRFMIS